MVSAGTRRCGIASGTGFCKTGQEIWQESGTDYFALAYPGRKHSYPGVLKIRNISVIILICLIFTLTEEEMKEIAALDQNKRYYTSTPELLERYVSMVPPVDEQK